MEMLEPEKIEKERKREREKERKRERRRRRGRRRNRRSRRRGLIIIILKTCCRFLRFLKIY